MKLLALTLPGNQKIQLPGEVNSLVNKTTALGGNIFGVVIGLLLLAAAIIGVFFIIYGGIKIVTSGGDPKNIQNGRNTIIYASVGLAVAFLAYMFVNIFCHFLGVTCFK